MKIIGHRGARGLAPENTIASLRKALEQHVDMIEFDVRVTKDKKVILNHDPYIHDQAGNKLNIKRSTYAELKNRKPDLTTFKQALEVIDHKVPVYLEIKPKVETKYIVSLLKPYVRYKADVQIASFSQKTLLAIRRQLPEVELIVNEKFSGIRAYLRARQLHTRIISMNQHFLWWGFIRGFKNSDWQLYTYTLNDPVKAKLWEKWGLSGVVTDYPDRFRR